MSTFSKPGASTPKKRLVAPASFSRRTAGPMQRSDTVASSELSEDAVNRVRRMKRPGTVAPAAPASKTREGNSNTVTGLGNAELPYSPWWVQSPRDIYTAQKMKHKKEQQVKEDQNNEAIIAHEALLRKQEEEAATNSRRSSRLVTQESLSMPMKIEKVVVISKMRDKDIKRDIADLDKKLLAAAKKRESDRETLAKALELVRLKEEDLMLTRERMVHIYRSASEAIIKQSQELSGTADAELIAYLDRKKDAPLVTEMVSHNDIKRASVLYAKFYRIEQLWAKLREFTHTVGKVQLRRKRALEIQSTQQRAQYHQAITDSIYNVEPMSEVSTRSPAKPSSGQTPLPPATRKSSIIGSPSPSQPSQRRGSALIPPPSPAISGGKRLSGPGTGSFSRPRSGSNVGDDSHITSSPSGVIRSGTVIPPAPPTPPQLARQGSGTMIPPPAPPNPAGSIRAQQHKAMSRPGPPPPAYRG